MTQSIRFLFVFNFIITLFILSCATKEQPRVVSLSANRRMAVSVKIISASSQSNEELKSYFSKISQTAIEKAYGSKVKVLPLQFTSPLETPENLYEIGRSESDDIFLVEAKVPFGFQIPQNESSSYSQSSVTLNNSDSVTISTTILNGANLRTVTVFNFSTPAQPNHGFQTLFEGAFAKSALASFPNPNIYPKSAAKHYADLLYVFSEDHEKNFQEPLTCENASQRYMYYKWAKELYELAATKGLSNVIGQQSEAHLMTTRMDESSQKVKILDDCTADAEKSFAINIDYGSITSENQTYLQQAFEATNFATTLKQYTDKPVNFRFQIEPTGLLSLFLTLRFDQKRFQAWTVNRIPQKMRNFQILSLDPYYALMQKMVIFRSSLPDSAPYGLKSALSTMKMMLELKTLLNGSASFPVDGKYLAANKTVRMAYPSKIFFSQPGSESKVISNRDEIIFQERGWIALGNCKTLDGTRTEDGLLYEFFGFPCR